MACEDPSKSKEWDDDGKPSARYGRENFNDEVTTKSICHTYGVLCEILNAYFIASVTAANYELDESPDLNTKQRVDDCRKGADAVADDSPRLIVMAVVAAHFDFCLRLKATDAGPDGLLAPAVYREGGYELPTTSLGGEPLARLLAALPLRRPQLARARAAVLDYFAAANPETRRVLLDWQPSTAKEEEVYKIGQQVDIAWGGPRDANASGGGPAKRAEIVRVDDPLQVKPSRVARVKAGSPPLCSQKTIDVEGGPDEAKSDAVAATASREFKPGDVVEFAETKTQRDGSLAHRLVDGAGWIVGDLEPVSRARTVDVVFADDGCAFCKGDVVRVRATSTRDAQQQSVSGVVKHVHEDGTFDFIADDAQNKHAMVWDDAQNKHAVVWERLTCARVVTAVPMAWIVGYAKGKKPEGAVDSQGGGGGGGSSVGGGFGGFFGDDSGDDDDAGAAQTTGDDPLVKAPDEDLGTRGEPFGPLKERAVRVSAAVVTTIVLEDIEPKPAVIKKFGKTKVEFVPANKPVVRRGIVDKGFKKWGVAADDDNASATKGTVKVTFSDGEEAEIAEDALLQPRCGELAKHMMQEYGAKEATFIMQDGADNTLQFIADVLKKLGGERSDFVNMVLPKIVEKRKGFGKGGASRRGGGVGRVGGGFSDDDSDFDDGVNDDFGGGIGGEEQKELSRSSCMLRAQMFAHRDWLIAPEVRMIRDFASLLKVCLEPITEFVAAHDLGVATLSTQLELNWTYENKASQDGENGPTFEFELRADCIVTLHGRQPNSKISAKSTQGEMPAAIFVGFDEESKRMTISVGDHEEPLPIPDNKVAALVKYLAGPTPEEKAASELANKRNKIEMTAEDLEHELPGLTLSISAKALEWQDKTMKVAHWQPKGFYRSCLSRCVETGDGDLKDSSKIAFDDASTMPGAVVHQSEHPYQPDTVKQIPVEFPGAKVYRHHLLVNYQSKCGQYTVVIV